jgi:hypothetical protein
MSLNISEVTPDCMWRMIMVEGSAMQVAFDIIWYAPVVEWYHPTILATSQYRVGSLKWWGWWLARMFRHRCPTDSE